MCLRVQELSNPQHKKSGRKPVWLNKDLLVKWRVRKDVYRQ